MSGKTADRLRQRRQTADRRRQQTQAVKTTASGAGAPLLLSAVCKLKMSNNFLNETQFRVHVASMQRRFEKVASIDPAEVSERLLADEEFRQKVMNAICTVFFRNGKMDFCTVQFRPF